MLPPTLKVQVQNPTGKTYANPGSGENTEFVPAGGLTQAGLWVPLNLDDNGNVILSGGGTAHFDDSQSQVTPGIEQVLLSNSVPATVMRSINQILVVTRVTGSFEIVSSNEIIGSGRTGPGSYPIVTFSPPRTLNANSSYQVNFLSRANAPVQSVECYVQATDTTIS